MITRLSIENYALIDKSVIDLRRGFTVITGETGAGKSIMLDALSLLMGARADSKVVSDKERKTIVEAAFTNPDEELKEKFESNGTEWDDNELIIRREISPSGKSRSFVNDTPVNLTFLSSLAENLIDIHSQHSNSLLTRGIEQLSIIDAFGGTELFLKSYQDIFKEYVALRNRIKKIRELKEASKENREFILFRLEQLEKIKPKEGELTSLEREAELLGDADRIKTDLTEAYGVLAGRSDSALKNLQIASSLLSGLNMEMLEGKTEDNVYSRLENLKIELRDISDTLEIFSEKINSDPQRLEKVQKRIELLYETMKRFKVKDESELVALYHKLKEELSTIDGEENDDSALELKLKDLAKILKEKAENLSNARKEAALKFSETIEKRISPLGLPNVKFNVEVEKGKMSLEGQDNVVFLCSFNKNHPMQPISEIASGGEISRVMLGIKSVMADKMRLPTIIFDEIDTGVSGEIAHKMGQMMKEMSRDIQVISVTHLPQVAASGNTHLKVYKADNDEKTVSHVKELDGDERINEIAGMLSGTSISEVSLENARMLLNSL